MPIIADTQRVQADNPGWDCCYLTGPTASGKTSVAIPLAEELGAEIISLDSMTVYRELDVGTAKPTDDEQMMIRHHMIDVVDPSEDYSLAEYVQGAYEKIYELRRRNKKVIFVGGTPLYLKAMLRGIFAGPPADPDLRKELFEKSQYMPLDFLHNEVKKIDPVSAKRLHPNDTKRLIRAIEVFRKSGIPISTWQQQFESPAPLSRCKVVVLDWPRELLNERINRRVDLMMDRGFLDEVAQLTKRFLPINQTAAQAIGYKELFDYLDKKMSLHATVELIKQNTRQFAKRQMTWFRSLAECQFISVHTKTAQTQIIEHIKTIFE
ncbi:MAG: tRNA (adenosine(37)-N6)-dimethylallyltransferase MiaA [Planctomycetaceae bacterium]|jgi:tRNA dimethylallyltransferase|nr:tRNA (adenosine(37)-N6)-dimethylallyltransferase MiaA [Planctomycetaceae bacterium]